jgi:hypothetical protein
MPLPIVLQGFFEEHEKVVCQYPYLKMEGVGYKVRRGKMMDINPDLSSLILFSLVSHLLR